jgi:hypothetical protein
LSEDVRWWHSGGDIVQAVNGCQILTKDNLILVGVLAEYYDADAILESHDQLLDNDRLKLGPDTRGALKHPAWDRWVVFWILDYTHTNCVDQTSTRIFYAVTAAENLIIFGADVSNAFAEAPPPKTGILHPTGQGFLQLASKPEETRPDSPRGSDPGSFGNARASRIPKIVGKVCQ